MGLESIPDGYDAFAEDSSYRTLHAAVMGRFLEAQLLQFRDKDKRYIELGFLPGEGGAKLAQFVLRERGLPSIGAGRLPEEIVVALPIQNFNRHTPWPVFQQGKTGSYFTLELGHRMFRKNEGETLLVEQDSYGRLFKEGRPIVTDILGKLLTYEVVEP